MRRGRTIIDRASLISQDLRRIREQARLVQNITNYVVMNTTANALLAIGASPVMAHAAEEVEEMAAIAGALVLNIGTLSPAWIDSMLLAGRAAVERKKPIVLDPVGAGATSFRTASAEKLLDQLRPAVVRGNGSEIRALLYREQATKGVDSTHGSHQALDAALAVSARYGSVVVVSGATDLVVSSGRVSKVFNGHPLMPGVTGLGCTATALIGAFAAVNPSVADAALHAMAVMGITGEIAAERASGPASFLVAFLDGLYSLNEADVRSRLRVEEA